MLTALTAAGSTDSITLDYPDDTGLQFDNTAFLVVCVCAGLAVTAGLAAVALDWAFIDNYSVEPKPARIAGNISLVLFAAMLIAGGYWLFNGDTDDQARDDAVNDRINEIVADRGALVPVKAHPSTFGSVVDVNNGDSGYGDDCEISLTHTTTGAGGPRLDVSGLDCIGKPGHPAMIKVHDRDAFVDLARGIGYTVDSDDWGSISTVKLHNDDIRCVVHTDTSPLNKGNDLFGPKDQTRYLTATNCPVDAWGHLPDIDEPPVPVN